MQMPPLDPAILARRSEIVSALRAHPIAEFVDHEMEVERSP